MLPGHDADRGAPVDPGRRAELVDEALPLVGAVARRLARRLGGHVNVDDLKSIGNVAVLDIVDTWDPARAKFAAYATWKLKCAMLDGVRRETHGRWTAARAMALLASERLAEGLAAAETEGAGRESTTAEEDQAAFAGFLAGHAAAFAAGLLAGDPDAQGPRTPEEKFARVEELHVARGLIAGLPPRDREIVERYFFGEEPLDIIARDFGITKSWASRLTQRALATVRQRMGVPAIEDPSESVAGEAED